MDTASDKQQHPASEPEQMVVTLVAVQSPIV